MDRRSPHSASKGLRTKTQAGLRVGRGVHGDQADEGKTVEASGLGKKFQGTPSGKGWQRMNPRRSQRVRKKT